MKKKVIKHKCIECDNLVYRKTALRCRTCANRFIALQFVKGIPKSEHTKKLLSIKQKIRLENPKNHPLYIDGRSLGYCTCIKCGNIISETSVRGSNLCKKCCAIGYKNPAYKDGRTLKKYFCKQCNKKISYNCARNGSYLCQECYLKTLTGKNNPNYIHGQSYTPYTSDFKQIRKDIRNRDNYTCQICEVKESTLKRNLSIHHINYNKQNNENNNLIALCIPCHLKTNGNRDYWFAYCTYIMENR
jgi:hypothetical protein